MKLLSAQQIKDWDAYTIVHEPISEINLMNRAAKTFVDTLKQTKPRWSEYTYQVYCGIGNNGGDGFAIARLLFESVACVHVCQVNVGNETEACKLQRELWELISHKPTPAYYQGFAPTESGKLIIIDAILGLGAKPVYTGLLAHCIDQINGLEAEVFSVDLPSGLAADFGEVDPRQHIVQATHTFTFQIIKPSFLLADTGMYCGIVHVLDIGLHPEYLKHCNSEAKLVQSIPAYQRKPFAHKGHFGHALLCGGSWGKMGASVLMTKAALRSGCGLATAYIPKTGYSILQTALPEAMVNCDEAFFEINRFPEVDASIYRAIALGPGMGMHPSTAHALATWLPSLQVPCVIDADALNIMAIILKQKPEKVFPSKAVLTPHPKEFDRLAGYSGSSYTRLQKQIQFARTHDVIVVLKGKYTSIATPNGELFFNTTGNAAMATAGSGDVLTGVICSFLAQGFSPEQAAVYGVFSHGRAGDRALQNRKILLASDIVEELGK